ncbi:30S ribosomal protein S16 [candidate division WOR-3 bacterium]|nr:30S ribosomal protein S16 [candidate division WOR-3 bacterium]
MVTIRLKRFGAKKNPHYRIVVTDSRRARDGAYIESLGSYNPRGTQTFTFDESRLEYWLSQGAQMSPRVEALHRRLARGEKVTPKNAPREAASVKPEPTEVAEVTEVSDKESEVKEHDLKEEDLKEEETEKSKETKTEATSTQGGSDEGTA